MQKLFVCLSPGLQTVFFFLLFSKYAASLRQEGNLDLLTCLSKITRFKFWPPLSHLPLFHTNWHPCRQKTQIPMVLTHLCMFSHGYGCCSAGKADCTQSVKNYIKHVTFMHHIFVQCGTGSLNIEPTKTSLILLS